MSTNFRDYLMSYTILGRDINSSLSYLDKYILHSEKKKIGHKQANSHMMHLNLVISKIIVNIN